jgi:hypothetical protein
MNAQRCQCSFLRNPRVLRNGIEEIQKHGSRGPQMPRVPGRSSDKFCTFCELFSAVEDIRDARALEAHQMSFDGLSLKQAISIFLLSLPLLHIIRGSGFGSTSPHGDRQPRSPVTATY